MLPSERGLQAWDVHRLVELTKDFASRRVPLAEIRELDENFWFDDDNPPTCRRIVEHMELIRDADFEFPVILGSDGRVMDGMHRVAKAVLEGRSEIEAVQFDVDPEPDFVGVKACDLPY